MAVIIAKAQNNTDQLKENKLRSPAAATFRIGELHGRIERIRRMLLNRPNDIHPNQIDGTEARLVFVMNSESLPSELLR
jgi:hypothetical protein